MVLRSLLCLAFVLRAYGEDYFGHPEMSEAALVGIFYDLKQTQRHEPTGVEPANYPRIVGDFLNKNWDEDILNRYFRASKPLYTTQLLVPTISADTAPKAFDVAQIVKPRLWVIHYKGQISPPEDGRYRFVGGADDFIAVAVNGKTVLVNGTTPPRTLWRAQGPHWEVPGGHCPNVAGDWLTLKKGDLVDLDILIGECPGGLFSVALLCEKEGAEYPKDKNGNAMLPLFQLAPYDNPAFPIDRAPSFQNNAMLWKCYQ